MLSIIYGILSAGTWGAADFIGGLASKRTSPYRVLFLAEIAGLIPFTALALLLREPIPPAADMLLGAGSSLLGLTGLLFLYRALADGQMTIAAPVSAVFAALIPVIFGFFSLGAPSLDHPDRISDSPSWRSGSSRKRIWRTGVPSAGFAVSRTCACLCSRAFSSAYTLSSSTRPRSTHFSGPWSRHASQGFVAFGLYALIARQPAMPPRDVWGFCIVNGMIDIGGNAFYVLAAQTGRIDVAAVLGALYPASTVLLAWIFLKERIYLAANIRRASGVCGNRSLHAVTGSKSKLAIGFMKRTRLTIHPAVHGSD